MQKKNLIVPLVGDFGGMRTLRMIGEYLREHNTAVSAFYISNVEQYLARDAAVRFRNNVAMLPANSTSQLVRFLPPAGTTLQTVREFVSWGQNPLFHLLHSQDDGGLDLQ